MPLTLPKLHGSREPDKQQSLSVQTIGVPFQQLSGLDQLMFLVQLSHLRCSKRTGAARQGSTRRTQWTVQLVQTHQLKFSSGVRILDRTTAKNRWHSLREIPCAICLRSLRLGLGLGQSGFEKHHFRPVEKYRRRFPVLDLHSRARQRIPVQDSAEPGAEVYRFSVRYIFASRFAG